MVVSTVSVSLDGTDDELRQLAQWLRDEDELRGRVTLMEQPISPGHMGGVLDTIQVVLTSGTAGSLVTSIIAWLGHRRATGKVTVKIPTARGQVIEMRCGSADDAQDILDKIDKILTNRTGE